MNVVIFILESFSKEFVGELNRDLKMRTEVRIRDTLLFWTLLSVRV